MITDNGLIYFALAITFLKIASKDHYQTEVHSFSTLETITQQRPFISRWSFLIISNDPRPADQMKISSANVQISII